MPLVADMVLPHLPVTRPEFDDDPYSYIDRARRQHPWLARMDQGYFVHGYQAVKDFSIMDDKLGPSLAGVVEIYGAQGTPWGEWMSNHVLALHGPEHVRIRNAIAPAFTPAAVNRFRSQMRDRITELLDEWAPKGQFDFYEFITNYPISVLCTMLGMGTETIPVIRDFLEVEGQVFSLRLERLPELLAGFEIMQKYTDDLVAARERTGPVGEKTLLDFMIEIKNTGQITDKELRSTLMVMFPGAYDTSRNTMTLTMYMMLQYPEHWERCARDKEFCAAVLEEMFRFNAVANAFRTAIEDLEYDGILFPKGTRFFFNNSFAARDPQSFADADIFNPERSYKDRHLAFGRGAHICPGQHLARAQIVEALHLIAQRIKKPKLAGEVKWRAFLGTCGPATLPIAFEPGPAPNTRVADAA
jgi:cytochrome P450